MQQIVDLLWRLALRRMERCIRSGDQVCMLGGPRVAVGLGIPLGLFAGYSGGVIDSVLSRVTDAFLSLPPIIFALGLILAYSLGGFSNTVNLTVSGLPSGDPPRSVNGPW